MNPTQDYSEAIRLAEIGRHRDALEALASLTRRGLKLTPELNGLLAELLQECGRYHEAESTAEAVLANSRSNNTARCRALCALARIRHVQASYVESSRLFAEAQRLATAIADARLVCLCQLSALGTVADGWPRAALAAHVSEVRQRVIRIGDRRLTARLHDYLARFEVLAGNIEAARRHLRAGRRLFEPEIDFELEARFAATEANICWFAAEYEIGLALCEKARRLSDVCGSAWNRHSIESTYCWLLLHLGRFDEAEQHLEARLILDLPPLARLIMLDTYADLALATGRTEQAVSLLEDMAAALTLCRTDSPSFYDVNWQESKVRLLAQKGDWPGAESVATEAISAGLARNERLAPARFRLFRCEALLRQRELARATADVVFVTSESESLHTGHRSQLDRVLGLLLEAHTQHTSAERHLARAVRINRSTGNAWANLQTEQDHARVASAAGGGALADPTDVAATMFQLASRADLLAHECVDLLRAHDCADAIAIVSIGPDDDAQLVPTDGGSPIIAAARADADDGTLGIPTGERGGRRFEVRVQPRDDLLARLTVINAKKIVEAALELERLRQAERERQSLWPQDDIADDEAGVFLSAEMTDLLATARRVAPTDIPVLLTGETGTGKEVLARVIHRASPRADKPFLAFNCAAVPRDMIESQLFGYRRGAFTGAQDAFPGVIRGATGGTLFLDEIGEIPPEIQPKLLRFLETTEIHPLGETHPLAVDARVVAATNADLDRRVGEGRFREDLLYRLNVVHFRLPPLRQRREEIPALVHSFLLRYADELRRGRPRVSEEAMEYLLLYGWPGNVRQLANEIRRAIALVEPDGTITPDTLSRDVRAARRTMPTDIRPRNDEMVIRTDLPLARVLERVERMMVARALERADGRFEEAARLLGVTRKGLFLKRKRLGLESPAG